MVSVLDAKGHPVTEDPSAIERACQRAGIHIGTWPMAYFSDLDGTSLLSSPDLQALALEAVEGPLTELKQRFAYRYEDIVGLNPQTPKLSEILKAFRQEHHHTDDEVRVVLYGTGIFGFVPPNGEPFELLVRQGDWIVVPAYTRHYFYLSPELTIIALRVFKDTPQWQAIYEPLLP
jgi:1,2-dihydroxy-3-keto-5-methylthiopentene dioxygenase